MRALIAAQTRTLTLFRSGKEPATGTVYYQSIGNSPAAGIAIEPGVDRAVCESSRRTLADRRGAGRGRLGIDLAETCARTPRRLRVVKAGGESAVLFAANQRPALSSRSSWRGPGTRRGRGLLHSTGPVTACLARPTGASAVRGAARARHVDMSELLRDVQDLPDLERRFRHEQVCEREPACRALVALLHEEATSVCRSQLRSREPLRILGRPRRELVARPCRGSQRRSWRASALRTLAGHLAPRCRWVLQGLVRPTVGDTRAAPTRPSAAP